MTECGSDRGSKCIHTWCRVRFPEGKIYTGRFVRPVLFVVAEAIVVRPRILVLPRAYADP